MLKKDILKNNKFLEKLSRKHEIQFLNHLDLICNIDRQRCIATTPSKNILHSDNAGHITAKGAKFIGQKILQLNWLNID